MPMRLRRDGETSDGGGREVVDGLRMLTNDLDKFDRGFVIAANQRGPSVDDFTWSCL